MHAKHSPIFLEILALVVKDETDRGWSFCEPSLLCTLAALRASVRFTPRAAVVPLTSLELPVSHGKMQRLGGTAEKRPQFNGVTGPASGALVLWVQ